MKFSNQLTDAQLERLAILAEELGEAQQAVGKILRHGYASYDPMQDSRIRVTNKDDLEQELGDVFYAIKLLTDNDLNFEMISAYCEDKAKRIKKYLHHQQTAQQAGDK